MNEQSQYPGADRSGGTTQFFSRLHRAKTQLKRRWWVLLLTLGLAVGAQVFRATHGPVLYTSHAQMIIGGVVATPLGTPIIDDPNNTVGTMMALMKGDQMAAAAVDRLNSDRPDLPVSPVVIDVNLLPRTAIFYLEGKGKDREYTRAYVNAILDEYIKYRKTVRMNSSDQTIKSVREQALEIEKDLVLRNNRLKDFQKTNQIAFVVEEAASDSKALITARIKLDELLTDFRLLNSIGTNSKSGQITPNAPPATTDQENARTQIAVYKAQEKDLAVYLRPKHPKMVALAKLIADQEKRLEVYLAQTQQQLAARRASLEKQIEDQKGIVKDREVKSLASSWRLSEFQSLNGNIQRAETLYSKMLNTLDSLSIGKDVQPEIINIIERATESKPENAGLLKNIAIGCFIGLIFGIGLLFLLDRFDDRPVSFSELSQQFEELVLGQIPQDNTKSKNKRTAPLEANDTRFAFTEAYRNLRSSLLFMAVEGVRPRTIVVTSAIPGEGKSTVAANLAITMAQSGSRVLLVDADMRKGLAHETFDLLDQPGLSDVLRQEITWAQAIQATSIPNLSLLAHGSHPKNPGELILNRSEHFLREVYDQFDYVLLDSAPILAADDTACLAPKADGVLFVIRAAYTSARLSHNALDALYQRQVNVLGLVFNSIETSSREYYYFKYPEYYSNDKVAQK